MPSSSVGVTKLKMLISVTFAKRRAADGTSSDAFIIFKVSTCLAASTAIILPASRHRRTSPYSMKFRMAARQGAGRCAAGEYKDDCLVRLSLRPDEDLSLTLALRLREEVLVGLLMVSRRCVCDTHLMPVSLFVVAAMFFVRACSRARHFCSFQQHSYTMTYFHRRSNSYSG